MAFFNSAVGVLQTLVIALGAGLGIWGVVNLMEGYGNDNPGAKSQGMKHIIPNQLEENPRKEKTTQADPDWKRIFESREL